MNTLELIEKAQELAGVSPVDGNAQRVTLGTIIRRLGGNPPAETGNWQADRSNWVHVLQGLLGFDAAHQDGRDGPMTWSAIVNKLGGTVEAKPPTKAPAGVPMKISQEDFDALDPHTKKWIVTLHPAVQPLALAHWKAARGINMPMRITSGIRSYAESDRLYSEHIHNGGPQAVPGGHSFHNFDERWGGLAYDFTLWNEEKNKPLWDSVPGGPNYVTVAKLGEKGGMYAGFHFGDEPHMELHPPWADGLAERQITAELRRRHDSNKDPVA